MLSPPSDVRCYNSKTMQLIQITELHFMWVQYHTLLTYLNFLRCKHFPDIIKHDQQDATLYNTLYYCQRCTCFERFFRSSSGAQVCTCSFKYLSNLFAVTASGNSKQVWQILDAVCTDLSSWWVENPLETCRELTEIRSIIQRCFLSVMLTNILTMHGPMNVKFSW